MDWSGRPSDLTIQGIHHLYCNLMQSCYTDIFPLRTTVVLPDKSTLPSLRTLMLTSPPRFEHCRAMRRWQKINEFVLSILHIVRDAGVDLGGRTPLFLQSGAEMSNSSAPAVWVGADSSYSENSMTIFWSFDHLASAGKVTDHK